MSVSFITELLPPPTPHPVSPFSPLGTVDRRSGGRKRDTQHKFYSPPSSNQQSPRDALKIYPDLCKSFDLMEKKERRLDSRLHRVTHIQRLSSPVERVTSRLVQYRAAFNIQKQRVEESER